MSRIPLDQALVVVLLMFEFQLMSCRHCRRFPDPFVTLHNIDIWSNTSRHQKEFDKMLNLVFHYWNNCSQWCWNSSEVAVGFHVKRKVCWPIRRNIQANAFQRYCRSAYKYIVVLTRIIITYLTCSNRPWSCWSWIDYLCLYKKLFNL